nr:expressed protein [Hymenolepis microstoma]
MMASVCFLAANQIQVQAKPLCVAQTTHLLNHFSNQFFVMMSAVLERFRAPFSRLSFPKNDVFPNNEDLEELIPNYPPTLTRPLQIKSLLPPNNFLLRSQKEKQKKPKERRSKSLNLKGRWGKSNGTRFENPDNVRSESEDRFIETKSSTILQFFNRMFRLINTMRVKKSNPRTPIKVLNLRHNRLQEDDFNGFDNEALNYQ